MPVPFIPCRRKDDRAVTRDIAATALPHFAADWEPIPDPDRPQDPAPPALTKGRTRAATDTRSTD